MSIRKRRDFYDEADYMYEQDRQEELDRNDEAMKEQMSGAQVHTPDEMAHVRAEVSQTYMEMFNNLLSDCEQVLGKHEENDEYLFESLDEVLDKYR